ncbi:MAG: pyridoxal-phosphate dependent enzyme [Bacteroidota bacterium]
MTALEEKINQLLSNSRIDVLHAPELFGEYSVHLLREDLIHPEISGNKLRKLKYNLLEAERLGKNELITFGGAYSNHIAATAAAGHLFGFRTRGIIRGDELTADSNETLQKAASLGMDFEFWSRTDYRLKDDPEVLKNLHHSFPGAYIIPEGGANNLGIQGCAELLKRPSDCSGYTHVVCATGTATTLVGLICSLKPGQKALGISVLKENYLQQYVENQLSGKACGAGDWEINSTHHHGGYARVNKPLIDFICRFISLTGTFAEPVYTGKMLFALSKMCQEYYFAPDSKMLAIHTGGLQGWNGFADLNPLKTSS